jgi:hypothetical protein
MANDYIEKKDTIMLKPPEKFAHRGRAASSQKSQPFI